MRIGIYLHQRFAADGGAFTFQGSLLEGLHLCTTRHELVLLHNELIDPPQLTALGLQSVSLCALQRASNQSEPARNGALRRVARRVRRIYRGQVESHETSSTPTAGERSPIRTAVECMGLDLVWYPDPASHSIDVDTPFFVTVWDLEHRKQPYFPEVSVSGWTWDDRQRHYTRVLPRAAAVFTGTAEGKDEVIRFFGVDPQRVIVNPFSLPMSQLPSEPLPGINQIDDCPYLLYPAQFWPHKNHVNLLHAVRQLHDRHGWHGHLVLTGSDKGNRQHVQEVVERLGLQDSVRFAGFVTSGELRQLYANASALVFPSLFGPDNLPPLEAFSLGCPVVASAIPGAVQQLGEAALLFDPLDPADMAMKIAEVLQQPSTRARLIHRGRTLVANRTPQRHVATVLAAADRFAMLRHNWAANFRHA